MRFSLLPSLCLFLSLSAATLSPCSSEPRKPDPRYHYVVRLISRSNTAASGVLAWTIKYATQYDAEMRIHWMKELVDLWKREKPAIEKRNAKLVRFVVVFPDTEEEDELGSYKYEHTETFELKKDAKSIWHRVSNKGLSWGLPDPMP